MTTYAKKFSDFNLCSLIGRTARITTSTGTQHEGRIKYSYKNVIVLNIEIPTKSIPNDEGGWGKNLPVLFKQIIFNFSQIVFIELDVPLGDF